MNQTINAESHEKISKIILKAARGVSGELYVIEIQGINFENPEAILDCSGDCISDLLDEEDFKKFDENEMFFEFELIVNGGYVDMCGEYYEAWIELISVTPLKVEFFPKPKQNETSNN